MLALLHVHPGMGFQQPHGVALGCFFQGKKIEFLGLIPASTTSTTLGLSPRPETFPTPHVLIHPPQLPGAELLVPTRAPHSRGLSTKPPALPAPRVTEANPAEAFCGVTPTLQPLLPSATPACSARI